ncbi:MAG: hypothetical protein V1799_19435 [bacterium]
MLIPLMEGGDVFFHYLRQGEKQGNAEFGIHPACPDVVYRGAKSRDVELGSGAGAPSQILV